MKPSWKWVLGILAGLVALTILAMPWMMGSLAWGGYGMMSGPRAGWHMPMRGGWTPMMGGGFGWMGFGGLLTGLIQLGVLVLIVLGIIWLVHAIGRQDQKSG